MSELEPLEYYINKFNYIDEKYIIKIYNDIKNNEYENVDYKNLNINCNCNSCKYCVLCISCYNCNSCDCCSNCNGCNDCINCNECMRCDDCINCKKCADCINCKECDDCIKCIECIKCVECIKCKNRNYNNHIFEGNIINFNINAINNINVRYLNSYLSSISYLYKGFSDEGLNIYEDEDIIKNIKKFEIFNKIDNYDKLNNLLLTIIELYKYEPNNEFIQDMIYNMYYLQIKECIEILTKNNIIKYL